LYDAWNHCAFADRFADAGFLVLGGELQGRDRCGNYRLHVGRARKNLADFAVLADSLLAADRSRLRRWRPPSHTRSTVPPVA
jgi:hypothetical protein